MPATILEQNIVIQLCYWPRLNQRYLCSCISDVDSFGSAFTSLVASTP